MVIGLATFVQNIWLFMDFFVKWLTQEDRNSLPVVILIVIMVVIPVVIMAVILIVILIVIPAGVMVIGLATFVQNIWLFMDFERGYFPNSV